MRILHLLKSDRFSGAENIALLLMDLFDEDETIYASPEGSIKEVVEQRKHSFYALNDTGALEIRRVIKEIKPDIVHAHDFSMATSAAFALTDVPVIVHLHNNPPWLKTVNPKSIMFACALPLIKHIMSVSEAVQKDYLFRGLMDGKNTVIGNVVDAQCVQSKTEEFAIDEDFDLIFLGRLTEAKDPIKFCAVINELKREYPDIRAVMVGDGDLRENIKQYILQHRMQNNILLTGFQKNPYPYLKASKVMVMPSKWEGFGLVSVEAMCLGKPVVCSGAGGLKNIITDDSGKICSSVSSYCEELKRLLTDKAYYEAKSKQARFISGRYTNLQQYKERILEKYKECISQTSRKHP